MLKATYATLDEIPEGDRQHYKKIGDRYVQELPSDHPVVIQNATLATEKKDEVFKANQRAASAEAEVQTLKTQAANQPTLPPGHVAIPADEAKLLDSIKELGEGADTKARVESVKAKITEHATLSTDNATMKKTQLLQQVATDEKLNFPILRDLDARDGGLQYEKRDVTVDNKTVQTWHVKRDNKWIPLTDHKADRWSDYKAVLESTGGTPGVKVPGQTADDKAPAPNLYKKIRDEAAERQKKVVENSIPLEKRLGQAAA